ncbi:MAG: hypothetical protein ACFE9Z_02640 [Promethearchaeota archaeon]
MKELNHKELKVLVKTKIIKNVKRVRGKHSPISEAVNNVPQSLKIEEIYDLSKLEKHFFLIITRNYNKEPKLRYFLAISLANNSSDLLVQLARDFIVKSDLKLIQYAIFIKTLRIQLLLLKEIYSIDDYSKSFKNLKNLRTRFRSRLLKIRNFIENE